MLSLLLFISDEGKGFVLLRFTNHGSSRKMMVLAFRYGFGQGKAVRLK